jgi:hypothetical protein
MSDETDEGFGEGVERSAGDPRVLFAMNAVLSTGFALFIAWGLAFVDVWEFTPVNAATLAILLFAVTYLVTS